MNKLVLLWAVALATLVFGATATATTQRSSQAYALSAGHVLAASADAVFQYVRHHI